MYESGKNKNKGMWFKKGIISILILMAIALGILSGCTLFSKKSTQKHLVEDMVIRYMTALKNKDVEELLSMSQVKMDDQLKKQAISGLKKIMDTMVDMDIKDYKIKKVEVDGSIAFVIIEETRKIAPKGGGLPDNFETGYKTVEETLVLIRREGAWKIDAINSLHLSKLDMKDTQKVTEELNNMGIARLFTFVVDPDIANLGVSLTAILAPNFLRARSSGQYTQCQSNMKNIGTALEMYSTDHSGHYPESLDQLTPDYLRVIPTCAAAGKDTYSASYKSAQNPDTYEFFCEGSYHSNVGVPSNYPQYNSVRGLISRPEGSFRRTPVTPPRMRRSRRMRPSGASAQGALAQCKSNCKNIGTALEMYSTDNAGHYPTSLDQLTPDYLRFIPTCPSAGEDTYSKTYKSGQNPDRYEFHCSGSNHTNAGIPPNYPQYNSVKGLVTR